MDMTTARNFRAMEAATRDLLAREMEAGENDFLFGGTFGGHKTHPLAWAEVEAMPEVSAEAQTVVAMSQALIDSVWECASAELVCGGEYSRRELEFAREEADSKEMVALSMELGKLRARMHAAATSALLMRMECNRGTQ